ncbi:MAG: hypothetical protein JWN40_4670 [Phycisphaerales bacterium]|nr:hypothetical protein [Phycisphaerales bacterium]
MNGERCFKCGSDANEWTVEGLSLHVRCAACKSGIVATSWEPVLAVWHSRVRVYRDGELAGEPVLEGVASALHDSILELAVGGAVLVLCAVE